MSSDLKNAGLSVRQRSNKRWLWVALCRRTRQVVSFVIGNRSAKTCARLWTKTPSEYRGKQSFSDFWKSYRPVFEEDPTHERVGKGSGDWSHVERFIGLIRQGLSRCARETRKASQTEWMLHLRTDLFIERYNHAVTHHLPDIFLFVYDIVLFYLQAKFRSFIFYNFMCSISHFGGVIPHVFYVYLI